MNIPRKNTVTIILIIILAIALHAIAAINHDIMFDGDAYIAMARSFAREGEFHMDWGTLWPPGSSEPGYSHWCAPLFPMYLGTFYFAFGYSIEITIFASLLLSVLAIMAVYFTTKSLFNARYALYASAIVAMNPLLVLLTAYSFSENMVLLFFTLALWAMIKGMSHEKYLLFAGLFAALGYLSRANVGYFFIIAALIGMAWRYKFMGLSFLKNRYYLGAMVIFGSIFGFWTARNLAHFGFPNWETNPMITEIVAYSLGKPVDFMYALLMKTLLFAVFILTVGSFFLNEMRFRGILKDEKGSGYMLGVTLPICIAILFMGSYHVWLTGHGFDKYIFWEEGARYIVISEVPLLWYAFHMHEKKKKETEAPTEKKSLGPVNKRHLLIIIAILLAILSFLLINPIRGVFIAVGIGALLLKIDMRKRIAILLALLTITSVLVSVSVDRPGYIKAAKDLNPMLGKNDTLALDFGPEGGTLYLVYPYLDRLQTPPIRYYDGCNTTYIISTESGNYDGYSLYGAYESDTGIMGTESEVPFVESPGRSVIELTYG